jgi:hypothetical protein
MLLGRFYEYLMDFCWNFDGGWVSISVEHLFALIFFCFIDNGKNFFSRVDVPIWLRIGTLYPITLVSASFWLTKFCYNLKSDVKKLLHSKNSTKCWKAGFLLVWTISLEVHDTMAVFSFWVFVEESFFLHLKNRSGLVLKKKIFFLFLQFITALFDQCALKAEMFFIFFTSLFFFLNLFFHEGKRFFSLWTYLQTDWCTKW